MNTRLEIASRALAGMLANPQIVPDCKTLSDVALFHADALIDSEEQARKVELSQAPENAASRKIQDDIAGQVLFGDCKQSQPTMTPEHEALRKAVERVLGEVKWFLDHGANSNGHLEAIKTMFQAVLDEDAERGKV